jgi:hypothetical protein
VNIGSNHRDTQSNTRKVVNPPTQRSQLTGALCVFCAAAGFSFKSILIKLAYVYPVDAATLLTLPGKPQQNGRHERMHRTLEAVTTRPPAGNLRAQQRKLSRFQNEFNTERPHEALDMHTPDELYTPSTRPMPNRLPSSCAWHAPRARPRGQRSAIILHTMLNTYGKL